MTTNSLAAIAWLAFTVLCIHISYSTHQWNIGSLITDPDQPFASMAISLAGIVPHAWDAAAVLGFASILRNASRSFSLAFR